MDVIVQDHHILFQGERLDDEKNRLMLIPSDTERLRVKIESKSCLL